MGEIYDEFDRDIASGHRAARGTLCDMRRWPGWSWTRSATVPTGGEKVLVDGWWLEVLEVDHHVIQRLRLRPRTQPTGESNDR